MLAGVSARLGAVTGMQPRYRLGYVGAAMLAVAAAARLLLDLRIAEPLLRLVAYDLPLAIGAVTVLATAWMYWGWLLHER